jgi:peptidoglycan/xylan/chitin deacetylase (PgdA/CDA1 family)
MKKNLFIILISTLFILVLIYLYDEQEKILNKEYRDYKKNISIDYPFFNNIIIDNYLNDYLESFIKQENDLVDLLFIDYDYEELEDRIELILYIYKQKENTVQKYSRKIEIDVDNGLIIENNKIIDTSIEYDIYNQTIIKKDKPMIALTFDDGPNHNTSRVLDILEKYNAKATFFILGTNIKGNEKTIKRMNELNMEIGNHMYSHKLLTKLENDKILSEIEQVDNLIFDIINEYPSLIRPSYGTINNRIKKIINRPIIIWNTDTLDWKYHNSKSIANKVLKHASDGDIILMHDIYRATANSLEIIIPKLLEDGYQLVTVSELLYYKGITPTPGKVYSNVN